MILFTGFSDHEVSVLARVAEDLGDVPGVRKIRVGLVRRDGFNRQEGWLFPLSAVYF